jgi:hypothetical protein
MGRRFRDDRLDASTGSVDYPLIAAALHPSRTPSAHVRRKPLAARYLAQHTHDFN